MLSVHALPPEGRSLRSVQSLVHSWRLPSRPHAVGGSSLPALLDRTSHERAARPLSRQRRPYLAPALLVERVGGRMPPTSSWNSDREEIIQSGTPRPYLWEEGEKRYSVHRVLPRLGKISLLKGFAEVGRVTRCH